MTTKKELVRLTGGLSAPSKMPGSAWSISAKRCVVGSLLRKVEGSTCSKCYALKGRYAFRNVQAAQERRLEAFQALGPEWVKLMVELIAFQYRNRKGADRVFRWFDSGDLQSLEMFEKIIQVAKKLPDISFWLPTRERAIVQSFQGEIPDNLIVRVSAAMIGRKANPPKGYRGSSVNNPAAFQCDASSRAGECGPCRACWLKDIPDVSYRQH